MNSIATIKHIAKLAAFALEELKSSSMKSAKNGISDRNIPYAGYEHRLQSVDLSLVTSLFYPAMITRTKKDFAAEITSIQDLAADMLAAAEEQDRTKTLAHNASRIANQHCESCQRNAEALATAQAAFKQASDASWKALELAVKSGSGDEGSNDTDSAEFKAYEDAEYRLTKAGNTLLKASALYSIGEARRSGSLPADIDALESMFHLALTDHAESYHPGRRNELVELALKIPT